MSENDICECGHPEKAHYETRSYGKKGQCGLENCKCPSYRHEPEEELTVAAVFGFNAQTKPEESHPDAFSRAMDATKPEESEPEVKECRIVRIAGGLWAMVGHPTESNWCPEDSRESLAESLTAAGFTIIPNPNEGEGEKPVEAEEMAEPEEAVRANSLSQASQEEMRSAVEIAKRFTVHNADAMYRVSKMVDLILEAESVK